MKKIVIAFIAGAVIMTSGQIFASEFNSKKETLNELNYDRNELIGEKEHNKIVIEAMQKDNKEVLEKMAAVEQEWAKQTMKSRVVNNLLLIEDSEQRIKDIDKELENINVEIKELGSSK